jgi:hypothetical protein
MSLNAKSMSVVGAAIILAFGAELAVAQAKSTKRIPISKEAPGEVVRVDTVMRVDTLQITNTVFRTDTLTRTMVRVDTVTLRPPPLPIILPNGLYFGAAGGSSSPDGAIYIPNSMGYIGQLHIGWQNAKQALGGRISGTYTGLGRDSRFSGDRSAKIWTMSTDLKANLPLGRVFGRTPKLAAYGIGGWTYTWYRDLAFRLDTPDDTPVVFALGDDSWTGRNGWDAGGGLSLYWGRSEIFIESRVLGFKAKNRFIDLDNRLVDVDRVVLDRGSRQARQIPLVFGFNWY